jgi:hypothetical protein
MATKKRVGGRRRGAGRPRVHASGAKPAVTQLAPKIWEAVDRLAAHEKRSLSVTVAILVEEALKARGELKENR